MDLALCSCYWLSDHRDSDSLGTTEQGETEGFPRRITNGLEHEVESSSKGENTLYAVTLTQEKLNMLKHLMHTSKLDQ